MNQFHYSYAVPMCKNELKIPKPEEKKQPNFTAG